jgi:hypothetical protein
MSSPWNTVSWSHKICRHTGTHAYTGQTHAGEPRATGALGMPGASNNTAPHCGKGGRAAPGQPHCAQSGRQEPGHGACVGHRGTGKDKKPATTPGTAQQTHASTNPTHTPCQQQAALYQTRTATTGPPPPAAACWAAAADTHLLSKHVSAPKADGAVTRHGGPEPPLQLLHVALRHDYRSHDAAQPQTEN